MPIDYEIAPGDCINSVALRHGFFPDTLWNHGSNAELKERRKDPNVLMTGDKLFIPDIKIKEVDKATEKRHRFRRKGVPAKLHLRFLKPKDKPPKDEPAAAGGGDDESTYVEPEVVAEVQEMEPIADAPYRMDIDGTVTEGTSDGDGVVKVSIPPDATKATFIFHPGTPDERIIPMTLGEMDPADTIIGARKRLSNLGYRCTTSENEMTPELKDVVGRFQKDNDLKVDGELNDATKNKLKEKHGC